MITHLNLFLLRIQIMNCVEVGSNKIMRRDANLIHKSVGKWFMYDVYGNIGTVDWYFA